MALSKEAKDHQACFSFNFHHLNFCALTSENLQGYVLGEFVEEENKTKEKSCADVM